MFSYLKRGQVSAVHLEININKVGIPSTNPLRDMVCRKFLQKWSEREFAERSWKTEKEEWI